MKIEFQDIIHFFVKKEKILYIFVVKVKVRRQLSCRFFQLRSFLDKEEEVGGRPCASNFVVPGWKLNSKILYRLAGMRLFPRAGNYMVSLKDQLWIHDYDRESCNERR